MLANQCSPHVLKGMGQPVSLALEQGPLFSEAG